MSAAYSWKPGSDILAPADQSIRSHDTGTARSSNQSVRSHDASTIRSECATQRTRSTYSGGLTVLSRPRTRVDSPSQIPPVGTYNLPTTFDRNSNEMRKSASFISIGRGEQFFERGTTYIKSQRAATAQQNLGPGSYNLAYTWSPDSNSSSRASPTCPDGACTSSSYRECCAGRLHPPGQYEKPWQNERSIAPIMTPRERQQGREHLSDSIDSVRHLPTY